MEPSYRLLWRLPDGDEVAADGYRPLNLLAHADMIDLDLPQACGGQAECGTCRVRVVSGEVTPPTPDELELRARFPRRFAEGERLSCRARPRGDLVIEPLRVRPPDLRDLEDEA